jgi:aminoglycoside phosphotransferase (APT) family kinase protein
MTRHDEPRSEPMPTPHDRATLQRIVQRWRDDAEVVGHRPLDGGISAAMTAVEVAIRGAREQLVVREAVEHWHDIAMEHRLLAHLEPTPVPAPPVLLFDDSREILPAPYLLLRYVEGAWTVHPSDRTSFARRMADVLAAIHEVPLPPLDLPEAISRPQWQLDHREPSRALDALAAALPFGDRNPPRLLHGDYWPCNVLWQDGEVSGVLDWEDAAVGDPLLDLAVCRLDLTLEVGADVRDAFTARYLEVTTVDPTDLPKWDLHAAIHAAPSLDEWAAGWVARGYERLDAAHFRAAHGEFLAAALKTLGH